MNCLNKLFNEKAFLLRMLLSLKHYYQELIVHYGLTSAIYGGSMRPHTPTPHSGWGNVMALSHQYCVPYDCFNAYFQLKVQFARMLFVWFG